VRFSIGVDMRDPYPEIIRSAVLAEEMGYDILWIPDEMFEKDPYAVMAACAIKTRRIGLGIGVTNPYTRSPVVTARAIATCAEISGGRAILGLGAGNPTLANGVGIQLEKPAELVRETAVAIRELLHNQKVVLERKECVLREVSLDFNVTHSIPIYIAGRGARILETGGKVGDGVIAGAGLATPNGMRYALQHIARGSANVGRELSELDIVCWAFSSLSEQVEEARDCVRPMIAFILRSIPAKVLQSIGLPPETCSAVKRSFTEEPDLQRSTKKLRELIDDRYVDQFSIVGSTEDCIKRVKELREAGVNHLGILPFANPSLRTSDIIKRFRNEVVSNL